MPNTNCLEGMNCPKCGANEPFGIEISTTAIMFDQGNEYISDIYWDGESHCTCQSCQFDGRVKDFTVGSSQYNGNLLKFRKETAV